MLVVGFLHGVSAAAWTDQLAGFTAAYGIWALSRVGMSQSNIAGRTASSISAALRADASLAAWRDPIAALALRYAFPTIASSREVVVAGSLMGYGASQADGYRQAGIYVGRILKGEKPINLPVEPPHKVRVYDKSKNCQGTRHQGTPDVPCPRRQSYRVTSRRLAVSGAVVRTANVGNRCRDPWPYHCTSGAAANSGCERKNWRCLMPPLLCRKCFSNVGEN